MAGGRTTFDVEDERAQKSIDIASVEAGPDVRRQILGINQMRL